MTKTNVSLLEHNYLWITVMSEPESKTYYATQSTTQPTNMTLSDYNTQH